jgi:PAS domain S-box-containing protein
MQAGERLAPVRRNQLAGALEKYPTSDVRESRRDKSDSHFVVSKLANSGFHIESFDDAFAESLGKRQLARGKHLSAALPSSICEAVEHHLGKCVEARSGLEFKIPVRRNGVETLWKFTLTPLQDTPRGEAQVIARASAVAEDPVDEQDHDHEIDPKLLERLAATTHDILYVADLAERKITYINQRVQRILGYDAGELQNCEASFLFSLVHPGDQEIVAEHLSALSQLRDREIRSVEYRARRADGHYVWLRSSDTVLKRTKGVVNQIIGSAIDVSDNRHLLEDLKRISSRLLETQNQERRRIARELHDSTAQHLVAVGLAVARLDNLLRPNLAGLNAGEEVGEIIAELRQVSREAQREIRAFSYLLHPPILESLGLGDALRRFVTGFSRRTRIQARLSIANDFSCGSHGISTALMRVAQEALINVFRHARATEVRISLSNKNRHTVLEIRDNGKGFPNASNVEDDSAFGVGILGMRARVQQFRGELELTSDSKGTLIRASIPERAASIVETAA